MTMTEVKIDPRVATLDVMRRDVEALNWSWFEALRDGGDVDAAKQAHKQALAEYRKLETEVLAAGVHELCGRCGGDGVVHHGRITFDTHEGPQRLCFTCGGAKTMPVRKHKFESQAPSRFKRWQEQEAKRVATERAERERWDAFAAEHADVAEFLAPHVRPDDDYPADGFLCSMRESVLRYGSLTEKQMAAVRKNMERAADDAAAVEFPHGTVEVEGEIVSLPQTRGHGYGGSKTNMLVKLSSHRGNRVMGSVPEKVWRAMEAADIAEVHGHLIGSRVRFTASFTQSNKDEHFGFFKSPKGVEVLYVNRGEASDG